jgi:hypothetical protein
MAETTYGTGQVQQNSFNTTANTSIKASQFKPAKDGLSDPREAKDSLRFTVGGSNIGGIGRKNYGDAKPDFANSLRYPSNPGITPDTDYVLFDFWEYIPPFAQDTGVNQGAIDRYNASAEAIIDPLAQFAGTSISAKATWGEKSNGLGFERSEGFPQIMLYMPEDIGAAYKGQWAGHTFSNGGANAMRTGGQTNAVGVVKQGAESLGQAINDYLPTQTVKAIQEAVYKATGETVSSDEILGGTRGVIENPNVELLYSKPEMRGFSLKFKLVPRNATEATNIEKIITTFKKAMLPTFSNASARISNTSTTLVTGGLSALGVVPGAGQVGDVLGGGAWQSSYVKVPKLVQVTFMSGAKPNMHVPQYKRCALSEMNVNFTPDGVYATTQDGRMVAYTLDLTFLETKLIFSEEAEYY